MSLINVAPLNPELSPVDYLGGTVAIPTHHQWVGVAKGLVASTRVYLMVSFAERPAITANGNFDLSTPGTDFYVIGQVGLMPTGERTLRKVRNHTTQEVLEANIEELAYKVTRIIESTDRTVEEKVHALLCPEHGVFPDFLAHQLPTAEQALQEDEDEVQLEADPHVLVNSDGLPPEVADLLGHLEAQGLKVKVVQLD